MQKSVTLMDKLTTHTVSMCGLYVDKPPILHNPSIIYMSY